MEFTKATKKKAKLRLTINGPAGSGKTYTALAIASAIAEVLNGRTAAIDTEHGSLSKYGHVFDCDVLELDAFAPSQYVQAIEAAERGGYTQLVIDSLSHEWTGQGGALEMADKFTEASRSKNSYVAWGKVTPEHVKLIEKVLTTPMHVIATMRTATEYLQQSDGAKTEIVKVGMAPKQRNDVEYEFDIIGVLDMDHTMTITKSRLLDDEGNNVLEGRKFHKPGAEFAHILLTWLERGADIPKPPTVTTEQTLELMQLATEAGLCVTDPETGEDTYPKICQAMKVPHLAELLAADFERCRNRLQSTIRANAATKAA